MFSLCVEINRLLLILFTRTNLNEAPISIVNQQFGLKLNEFERNDDSKYFKTLQDRSENEHSSVQIIDRLI